MAVSWRPPGGSLGTIDLRELRGDQIVIHYGGSLTSVDAYTFANSLVGFADTIRAINGFFDPEQHIEVRLESLAPGSFRAVVKRIARGLGGFFTRGSEAVFWAILATLIYDKLFLNDPDVQITINTEEVIIEKNGDKIIVPRVIYDQLPRLRSNPGIQRNLSKTFEVIENDDAIENFGLTPNVQDAQPLIQIPRDEFAILASPPEITEREPSQRERLERARLIILKAWLRQGRRKWSFEWNGVPISAPITDPDFWIRIESRDYLIGAGDGLDAEIKYEQQFDSELGVYVNDPQTFEVVRVFRVVPRAHQPTLPR